MTVTMQKAFKDATGTSTGQGADSEGGCFGQWVTLSVLNQEGQGQWVTLSVLNQEGQGRSGVCKTGESAWRPCRLECHLCS